MENFWNDIKEKKPFCYKSGFWEGNMSDQIILRDKDGKHYIGVCYEGYLDGSEFCDFYDNEDCGLLNITHWSEIPS